MMKIETAGAAFAPCGDRFVPNGYRQGLDFEEQLAIVAEIEGLKGIPGLYPTSIKDPAEFKKKVQNKGLQVGTVGADTYTLAYWKDGTLANRNSAKRKEAIRLVKDTMDVAAELEAADVLLWLGHDGYDYTFEADYLRHWDNLVAGLTECAGYRDDVKLTVEYKMKEPRCHQYISTIGKSLLLCNEVGKSNLGVVIDLGHSFFAGENPAESVALANRGKSLFHIHLNDNYRSWDDDLLLGSVHFWETLEFFYQLKEVGYDGWCTIDIWPSRVDGTKVLQESVDRIRLFEELADSLPREEIGRLRAEGEIMDLLKLIREYCIRKG
jgi:sugar phosphate isomerase/epimerase